MGESHETYPGIERPVVVSVCDGNRPSRRVHVCNNVFTLKIKKT
jgi:hypothetical protein